VRAGWWLALVVSACAGTRAELVATKVTLAHAKAGGPNERHMRRLASLAPAFAQSEGARVELVQVAALLHDATKETGAGTPYERFCTHGEAGAALARQALPPLGFSADEVETVAAAIVEHMGPCGGGRFMTAFCQRSYPAPSSVEAKVLFDLDMLDLMTVNGVAKVVELRQLGAEFGRESVEASAASAWKSVGDAREVLVTKTGQACGAQLTAHTRAFLDQARFDELEAFKAQVVEWLRVHPLPACVREP
jgi:hypothetical protein